MEHELPQSKIDQIVDFLWQRKVPFLLVVAAFFFAIHSIVVAVDSFDPVEITDSPEVQSVLAVATTTIEVATTSPVVATTTIPTKAIPIQTTNNITIEKPKATVTQPAASSLPTRIVINKIGVDVKVSNPTSTNDDVLNNILLSSVLRYAGSGTVSSGNMLIMGHSSELPVIHNPLYKVFTKLKTLKAGDEITIYTGTFAHTYSVTSVRKVNTHATDAYVSFKSATPKLTLLTCNVLAEKSDRYLVEADLVY